MKILFLHLSDAHLRDNTKLSDINPNAIVNSLGQMGDFDECIFVFSGDIAYSGKPNEYKVAGGLFGKILKGISEKYLLGKHIRTLIVPGNHDNLAKVPERNGEDIKKYFGDNCTDSHYQDDLFQLKDFFEFANRNGCYKKARGIEVQKISFGNFVIKVNLINSAPFSILGSDNGDKGRHYFPDYELSKLDFDRHENFTISIIHHGPEWFSDDVKRTLFSKMYATSELVFVGHEHFSQNEDKVVNGGKKIDISTGIALYGTDEERGFNAIVLDTNKGTLIGYKFIYNGKIYKPSSTPVLENKGVEFRGKNKFTFTREFRAFLESDTDQREGARYLDYFVFPSMEAKNINEDLKNYNVTSEEKFMELFKIKRKISIEGTSKSGKTILAKYLALKLSEDFVPLYLTEEDFGAKSSKKILKYALDNQYGNDADLDEYLQLSKEKKVLIVDRYDKLEREKWKTFLEEVGEEFAHIILLCGPDWNLDIKERALEELTVDEVFYLKICPFYYGKREELITRICSTRVDGRVIDLPEKVKKINDEITSQIKYFQLNPDFIHQYVDYYLNNSYAGSQDDNNVFNKVFEANITFRIRQNAKKENVAEILIALDYVAYYIHFQKKYPLPVEEFKAAVKAYNEKYDNDIDAGMVYDVAKKANIIKEISGNLGIEFCDENILAYFTAMHLNRAFNEGECQEELKYVLDNICFGINGDIILFLSYIASNIQILNPIMESIVKHMDSWEELSLDEKNIEYLYEVSAPIKTKLPDKEDKKRSIEQKSNMEREIVEEKKVSAESLYSYDEKKANSFENKITKAINYLELVAKILPNFRHILTGPQKQAIVQVLYSYPNKLLYFMLKDISDNRETIIDDILKRNPKTKKGLLITRDMLKKSIQNLSISYILSIYDFVASTASGGKAVSDLNKFNYSQNTNYRLENIMIEENVGNFHNFSSKVQSLYKTTEYDVVKQMTGLVVRKYFLNHDVNLVGEAQRLVDMFFLETEKKDLQMIQAKNRIVKK